LLARRPVTADDVQRIDECELSNVTHSSRKVANVIARTMGDIGDEFGLPDVFYASRVKHLAVQGLFEAPGNLNRMWFSEVWRREALRHG
jgi:hypothetical protein